MTNYVSKKAILGAAFVVALVLIVGAIWFAWDFDSDTPQEPTTMDVGRPAESKTISLTSTQYPATLDRALKVSAPLSQTELAKNTEKINELTKKLRSNPLLHDEWILLGAYRKAIGDYAGAAEAWSESVKLYPNDRIAYGNLGDLYHYYLKDYSQAEQNLKKVISIKPDDISAYRNLFDLYMFSSPAKKADAAGVLLDGIAKNPKSTELMVLLASYYRDEKNFEAARTYYQKALALNPPNRVAIEAELASLK